MVYSIVDSTYFIFNNTVYKQNFGTPIGSSLLPIIVDLVMQKLERMFLLSYNNQFLFCYRYVDDLLLVPSSEINSFFESFNSFHLRLQFMLETGFDSLNFLDVTIMVKKKHLIFDWHQKPTCSGRFLNYFSNYPIF